MLNFVGYRIKERLGIPFYTRPQTYRVTLDLFLENKGADASVQAVVPIPQETDAQHIRSEAFSWPVEFFHDSRFQNRVALWNEKLEQGEHKGLKAEFEVTVAPTGRHGALDGHEHDVYRTPNRFFESTDAREIAASILPRETRRERIVHAFNSYVVANFMYGNPITGLYSAQEAFEKRVVDCGGFDSVLCAFALARGIPARIVAGFWAGHQGSAQMHAWCELLIGEQWVPADPAIEHLVQKGRDRTKSGRIGFVGSDRVIFSVGCAIPLPNGSSAPILQHPFLLLPSDTVTLRSSYDAELL